jgi:hypothetical protein
MVGECLRFHLAVEDAVELAELLQQLYASPHRPNETLSNPEKKI